MSGRRCARCGTSVGPDEYLCWDCRQELPAQTPAPAMAGAASGPAPAATDGPPGDARTFRGARVPKGMVLPSRVQYHGTVFGLVAVGIVLVMVLGLLVSSGVGPFIASGVTVQGAGGSNGTAGTTVTATVTNRGSHGGKARCVALYTSGGGGRIPTQSVQTAVIPARGTGSVSIDLPPGASSTHVTIDCK